MGNEDILAFLRAIDEELANVAAEGETLELYCEDIQILCDTGDLTAEGLQSAVELAFAFSADEEEDPKRKKAYANLRTVVEYLEGGRRTL